MTIVRQYKPRVDDGEDRGDDGRQPKEIRWVGQRPALLPLRSKFARMRAVLSKTKHVTLPT